MSERLHITTAIIYSNGPPHVGHALELFATDAFVRYQRRKLGAANVTFVTGTDEHGEKNLRAAAAAGLSPKAFADRISSRFRETWAKVGISDHIFVRTTDPVHERFVQKMLQRAYDAGDIYLKNYEGLYCVGCERFYTEKELLAGNVCPEHNRPVEPIKEKNYFLKLEKYRERIVKHLHDAPDLIRPDRYRNEVLNMLANPLDDLCISRPKARMDWGIELPFDADYVTWVWYDAFWAYLSELPATDDASLARILPVTEHFIGKDILKTHAVYWPAMLFAAGLPLYRHLNVHGYLNFGGARFSKSAGNIADPAEYLKPISPYSQPVGADGLRYFLSREVTYGLDGDFSDERLIERYNSDLANNFGNLVSRVLSMTARYFHGQVKAALGSSSEPLDRPFAQTFSELPEQVGELIEGLAFNRALEAIWQAFDAANRYIVQTAPFALAKNEASLGRVAEILANLLESIRVGASVLEPFMPETSRKVLGSFLLLDADRAHAPFGAGIREGDRVTQGPPLFPRIETSRP